MTLLKSALLIFVSLAIGVGSAFTCCKCDDVGSNNFYRFKEIKLSSFDNSGKDTIAIINNTINKNAYALKVTLLSSQSITAKKPCKDGFGVFLNEANATSCGCGSYEKYVPADSVASIKIVDLMPFNSDPAGTDITSKFRYYNKQFQSYSELNTLVNGYKYSFIYDNNRSPSLVTGLLESSFIILLMEPPVTTSNHQFKIIVTLKSGATVEQTTSTVILQ